MALYLFTVSFESATELPADQIVNTWHFEGSGSDYDNVGDMLKDFYDSVPTGETRAISEYMSSNSITGNYVIKAYDTTDPKPRVPQWEDTGTLIEVSAGAALPSECAVCFSYSAAGLSGTSPARRRGRVFIGGLGTFAAESVAGSARPKVEMQDVMAASGRDLIQASNASVSWEWRQYSPTSDASALVTGGWVDNAFDTQRRRGPDATTRTSFTGGTP
uniref:Uncharacterized protein n=1 Tax=uncultured prokaryote TaxID=198431 RepID=A0A0H5Q3W5_9ZZZZ|nr:hypothetical protein [uncultured prokaryote]